MRCSMKPMQSSGHAGTVPYIMVASLDFSCLFHRLIFLLHFDFVFSRMTLLLGSPGSGKTTLLKALAGRMLDSGLKVSGRVTYNGHGMEEFVAERAAAYVSQEDLHNGEMTVRETLAFSAECQGTGDRHGNCKSITKILDQLCFCQSPLYRKSDDKIAPPPQRP